VIQMHGYNPANPVYVRWWAADERHSHIDAEFQNHQEVIYLDRTAAETPNTSAWDKDIMTVIAEVKRLFNVVRTGFISRVIPWGGGGRGMSRPGIPTCSRQSRRCSEGPTTMPSCRRRISRDSALLTVLQEKQSSWAMADGLLNLPIFVHHGDADQSVNVDYSRWGSGCSSAGATTCGITSIPDAFTKLWRARTAT